jgi:hypothetical protein
MKLGKLLGAGKSFFSGCGGVAYREDRRACLPKFNVGKNPFTPKPAGPAPAAAPETTNVSAPAVAKARTIPVPAAPQPARVMPARVTSWKDKLNPFRTPQPARPALANAVQVELSLEAVKVVHNDLADADIEVVPVKSRTVAQPEAPMLPPARKAWEFLGDRMAKQI